MGDQVVNLVVDQPGPDADGARERLAEALDGASVGTPDEAGVFDVTVDADSREDALHQVWNAIASAGADDHILFIEHPDIPEHWRTRPA